MIADLKNQLAVAEAKQRTLRRAWRGVQRAGRRTLAIVCAGSADAVKGFSLAVVVHGS